MPDIITLFLWFILYGFLGWVWETSFCSIRAKHFINRGFLNGPIIPVYGFGAVFVIIALSLSAPIIPVHLPLIDIPIVFIAGMIICTILEYITAVILESAFHIRWWDYSKQRFNFQGRICLKSALFFGLMSVVIIYIVQPIISNISPNIPANIENPLALVFLVLITIDLSVTISSLIHLKTHLENIHYKIENTADDLLEDAEELRDSIIKAFKGPKKPILRLTKAFPNSVSRHHDEILQRIKEHRR